MRNLTREELTKVIEGKGAAERIPLLYDIWIGKNIFDHDHAKTEAWKNQYPRDVAEFKPVTPGLVKGQPEDPDYYWAVPGMTVDESKGIDNRCVIEDWEDTDTIEEFYRTFPNPDSPAMMRNKVEKDERYLLCIWYNVFFERHWYLRGMENALTDYFMYPDEVHRLYTRLAEFYMRMMERSVEECGVDGFFVCDDIGTQTGPFFSLEIFREFFKPYFKLLIDKAHELGTHFWLHTCGNVELFMEDFIEIGLDVIHPIQKNTMSQEEVSQKYADRICILSGIDVQYLFAFGTKEEVREEVEYLIKTYARPEGRLMMTMGNGSTEDWKMENLNEMYIASLDCGRGYDMN